MSTAAVSARPPATLGGVFQGVVSWLGRNVVQAILSALLGAGLAFVTNVFAMGFYDGYEDVPYGSPFTGSKNLAMGSLFWGLFTTVAFGLFGYWRAVGTQKFFQDLANFPATLDRLLKSDGPLVWSHLLWGATVGFILAQFLSPWLAGVAVVGLLASAPSLLGRIFSNVLSQAASTILRTAAPAGGRRLTGSASAMVGMIGSAAALALGFFVTSFLMKLALVMLCVIAALILAQSGRPPTALFILAGLFLARLAFPQSAFAHDGGTWEANGVIPWVTSGGIFQVFPWALPAGFTAGLGSPFGWGLGNFLGGVGQQLPQEPPPEETHRVVPYSQEHYDRLWQLSKEIEDGALYERLLKLMEQGRTGRIDEAELDAIQRAQQGLFDVRRQQIDRENEAALDRNREYRAQKDAEEAAELARLRQEDEARANNREQWEDAARRLAEREDDPNLRRLYEDFLRRHGDDPEKLRQAMAAVQRRQSAATDQAEADAAGWEAWERGAKDIRDTAMTVNRALAIATGPAGQKVLEWQQRAYAAAEGYDQGGVKGAIGAAGANYLDQFSHGMATPLYNNDGNLPGALKDRLSQYNPAEYARRMQDIRQAVKEGDYLGAARQAADMGLDVKDARDEARDYRDRLRGGEGDGGDSSRRPADETASVPPVSEGQPRSPDSPESRPRQPDISDPASRPSRDEGPRRTPDEADRPSRPADDSEPRSRTPDEPGPPQDRSDDPSRPADDSGRTPGDDRTGRRREDDQSPIQDANRDTDPTDPGTGPRHDDPTDPGTGPVPDTRTPEERGWGKKYADSLDPDVDGKRIDADRAQEQAREQRNEADRKAGQAENDRKDAIQELARNPNDADALMKLDDAQRAKDEAADLSRQADDAEQKAREKRQEWLTEDPRSAERLARQEQEAAQEAAAIAERQKNAARSESEWAAQDAADARRAIDQSRQDMKDALKRQIQERGTPGEQQAIRDYDEAKQRHDEARQKHDEAQQRKLAADREHDDHQLKQDEATLRAEDAERRRQEAQARVDQQKAREQAIQHDTDKAIREKWTSPENPPPGTTDPDPATVNRVPRGKGDFQEAANTAELAHQRKEIADRTFVPKQSVEAPGGVDVTVDPAKVPEMRQRVEDNLNRELRDIDSRAREPGGMTPEQAQAARDRAQERAQQARDALDRPLSPVRREEMPGPGAVSQNPQANFGVNRMDTGQSRAVPSEHTTIHERIHAHASEPWKDLAKLSKDFNEGMTEHLAKQLSAEHPLAEHFQGPDRVNPETVYPRQGEVIKSLEALVGKKVLEDAYFHGDMDGLKRALAEGFGDSGDPLVAGQRRLESIATKMEDGRHEDIAARLLREAAHPRNLNRAR